MPRLPARGPPRNRRSCSTGHDGAGAVAPPLAYALLRLEDRGPIEPGKRADFMIVDGDPSTAITDIDRIVAVWHSGKQVAGPISAFAP